MNQGALLKAYGRMADRHGLPPMVAASAQIGRLAGLGPADAWARLSAFGPHQGWLQFQSRVLAYAGGSLPRPDADWGHLLAAEAVDDAGRSLSLGQDGRGGFQLTVVSPDDAPASAGVAGAQVSRLTGLADQVRHRATDRVPGPAADKALHYTRYWQADPERGLIPVLAAFIGFSSEEK
jgi:hypothetical protein